MDNDDLLSNEIARLKKQLSEASIKQTKQERFVRDTRIYGDMPIDEWSHQYKILYHPQQEPTRRAELFDPDILLGNIKDSKSLFFFQRDYALLHRFYDMGLRSPGVGMFFDSIYYSWKGQLGLTRALGGTERKLQSFFEPMQLPAEGFSYWQKREAKKQAKKGLRDYIPAPKGGEGPYE
jgi:hypothetical protein